MLPILLLTSVSFFTSLFSFCLTTDVPLHTFLFNTTVSQRRHFMFRVLPPPQKKTKRFSLWFELRAVVSSFWLCTSGNYFRYSTARASSIFCTHVLWGSDILAAIRINLRTTEFFTVLCHRASTKYVVRPVVSVSYNYFLLLLCFFSPDWRIMLHEEDVSQVVKT